MTQDIDFSLRLKRFYETVSGNRFNDIPPSDVFELILDYILPCDLAKEGARRLEARFGSVSAAMDAPVSIIASELNGNELAANFFKLVPALGSYYRVDKINSGRKFSSVDDIAEYCVHRFSNDRRELYCVLMVDSNMRMVGIETVAEGSSCDIMLDLERIGEAVFTYGGSGFLLIHNHPSGLAYPTQNDEKATKLIYELFARFNKKLLEHILISNNSYVPIMHKMRGDGTI